VDDGAAGRPGVLARLRAATAGGPLGNRSFLLLSGGQLASTIGDLCYAVALPWLCHPSSFRSSAKTQGTAAM
jgi:hypothetical protein